MSLSASDEIRELSKKLFDFLETRLRAKGYTLHEKIDNLAGAISPQTIKKLRYIATISGKTDRNAPIFAQRNVDGVRRAYQSAVREIEKELSGAPSIKNSAPFEPQDADRRDGVDPATELLRMSQYVETYLATNFGATGRGLHEKLSDVESTLSRELARKIRYLATLRNKAVHEDVEIAAKNYSSVVAVYREIVAQLDYEKGRREDERNARAADPFAGAVVSGPEGRRRKVTTYDRRGSKSRSELGRVLFAIAFVVAIVGCLLLFSCLGRDSGVLTSTNEDLRETSLQSIEP